MTERGEVFDVEALALSGGRSYTGAVVAGAVEAGGRQPVTPHGSGVLTLADGRRLAVEHEHGKRVLPLVFVEGEVERPARYVGGWAVDDGAGCAHGAGVVTFEDGAKREGGYHHGRPTGSHVETEPDGRTFEVEFDERGMVAGRGPLTAPLCRLPEPWELGLRDDEGRLHGADCRRTRTDGVRQAGRFEHGELAYGSEHEPDGTTFNGAFRDGKRHGEGKLVLPGGRELEATYRDGERVSLVEVAYDGPRRELGKLVRMGSGVGPEVEVQNGIVYTRKVRRPVDLHTVAVGDPGV